MSSDELSELVLYVDPFYESVAQVGPGSAFSGPGQAHDPRLVAASSEEQEVFSARHVSSAARVGLQPAAPKYAWILDIVADYLTEKGLLKVARFVENKGANQYDNCLIVLLAKARPVRDETVYAIFPGDFEPHKVGRRDIDRARVLADLIKKQRTKVPLGQVQTMASLVKAWFLSPSVEGAYSAADCLDDVIRGGQLTPAQRRAFELQLSELTGASSFAPVLLSAGLSPAQAGSPTWDEADTVAVGGVCTVRASECEEVNPGWKKKLAAFKELASDGRVVNALARAAHSPHALDDNEEYWHMLEPMQQLHEARRQLLSTAGGEALASYPRDGAAGTRELSASEVAQLIRWGVEQVPARAFRSAERALVSALKEMAGFVTKRSISNRTPPSQRDGAAPPGVPDVSASEEVDSDEDDGPLSELQGALPAEVVKPLRAVVLPNNRARLHYPDLVGGYTLLNGEGGAGAEWRKRFPGPSVAAVPKLSGIRADMVGPSWVAPSVTLSDTDPRDVIQYLLKSGLVNAPQLNSLASHIGQMVHWRYALRALYGDTASTPAGQAAADFITTSRADQLYVPFAAPDGRAPVRWSTDDQLYVVGSEFHNLFGNRAQTDLLTTLTNSYETSLFQDLNGNSDTHLHAVLCAHFALDPETHVTRFVAAEVPVYNPFTVQIDARGYERCVETRVDAVVAMCVKGDEQERALRVVTVEYKTLLEATAPHARLLSPDHVKQVHVNVTLLAMCTNVRADTSVLYYATRRGTEKGARAYAFVVPPPWEANVDVANTRFKTFHDELVFSLLFCPLAGPGAGRPNRRKTLARRKTPPSESEGDSETDNYYDDEEQAQHKLQPKGLYVDIRTVASYGIQKGASYGTGALLDSHIRHIISTNPVTKHCVRIETRAPLPFDDEQPLYPLADSSTRSHVWLGRLAERVPTGAAESAKDAGEPAVQTVSAAVYAEPPPQAEPDSPEDAPLFDPENAPLFDPDTHVVRSDLLDKTVGNTAVHAIFTRIRVAVGASTRKTDGRARALRQVCGVTRHTSNVRLKAQRLATKKALEDVTADHPGTFDLSYLSELAAGGEQTALDAVTLLTEATIAHALFLTADLAPFERVQKVAKLNGFDVQLLSVAQALFPAVMRRVARAADKIQT